MLLYPRTSDTAQYGGKNLIEIILGHFLDKNKNNIDTTAEKIRKAYDYNLYFSQLLSVAYKFAQYFLTANFN